MQVHREETQVAETHVTSPAWSPAQIVAIVLGAMFTILGAVTLARTGLNGSFLDPHVTVIGLDHTPLLGAIELVFGLLMVMAGAVPGAGRGTMTLLGGLALGFGIVILIEPSAFHRTLGVHAGNGWLYILTGVISLVSAMVAPVIFGSGSRYVGRDRDVIRRI